MSDDEGAVEGPELAMPRVSIAPEADFNTDINVLPLIDVLLVLIIVFFLIERNLAYIPAQIPSPDSLATESIGGQVVLDLKADGGMTVNGQPVPTEQLGVGLWLSASAARKQTAAGCARGRRTCQHAATHRRSAPAAPPARHRAARARVRG